MLVYAFEVYSRNEYGNLSKMTTVCVFVVMFATVVQGQSLLQPTAPT